MQPPHTPPTHINIDKKPYVAPEPVMTGEALRALAQPPVGPQRDLFLVVPGGDDEKIGNAQPVPLRPGMHFYSNRRIDPTLAEAVGKAENGACANGTRLSNGSS